MCRRCWKKCRSFRLKPCGKCRRHQRGEFRPRNWPQKMSEGPCVNSAPARQSGGTPPEMDISGTSETVIAWVASPLRGSGFDTPISRSEEARGRTSEGPFPQPDEDPFLFHGKSSSSIASRGEYSAGKAEDSSPPDIVHSEERFLRWRSKRSTPAQRVRVRPVGKPAWNTRKAMDNDPGQATVACCRSGRSAEAIATSVETVPWGENQCPRIRHWKSHLGFGLFASANSAKAAGWTASES